MGKAIGMKLNKVEGDHNLLVSKFYGTPVLPELWVNDFVGNEVFVAQIKLEDIRELDKGNKLPHTGYLYFFLDVTDYMFTPIVRYYDGVPTVPVEGFNNDIEGYEGLTEDRIIEFYECSDVAEGYRLLGKPSIWESEGKIPSILMQMEPIENEAGFEEQMEGYAYFIYGADKSNYKKIKFELSV